MKSLEYLIKVLVTVGILSLGTCQWPKVEKMLKSHYLPSLEVKIHPPDEFQPKVQAEIARIEAEREKTERELMQLIEKDYNAELNEAAKKITQIIKDALSVFDDKNLLNKSAEYAVNPPIIVMSKVSSPSFREVADFSLSKVQQDTMKALVDEDTQIERMRNPNVTISLGDGLETTQHTQEEIIKIKDQTLDHNSNKKVESSASKVLNENGPIDLDWASFLELNASSQQNKGKYSKPISVVMKLPEEPDGSIKSEISNMEKKRVEFEKKLFTKAKEEFKLITQITIKELQLNLNHELIPFFVVSKNEMSGMKSIIEKNFPKKQDGKSRFLELDPDETNSKFKGANFDEKDTVRLNEYAYSRILQMFSLNPTEEDTNLLATQAASTTRKQPAPQSESFLKQINNQQNSYENFSGEVANVDFDPDTCADMRSKYPSLELDCGKLKADFKEVSSFLETRAQLKQGGEEEFINVKFSAAEESYPTVEKLVAQMMTRRDLAEKFERLKILEFETNLQKAENEMIQDVLHENLYKIMAKYGPAIEGMKEHIR